MDDDEDVVEGRREEGVDDEDYGAEQGGYE